MGFFDFITNLFSNDLEVRIPHIHQMGTSKPYVMVKLDQEYTMEELAEHPAILTYPNLFEVIDGVIPEDVQYLNFQLPELDPVDELNAKVDALVAEIEILKNR